VTEREVSLDAQEASVAAIFADIGQRTGIPVVIYPGVDERITIHFTRVALAEALKQLTPNVALVTAQGPDAPPHRITKVYVFATGQARSPQRAVAPSPQAETVSDAAARPAPFQFTFDPSQHMKPSQ
jgi:type II secretory pathway component GspD/PulD (secretin)